jgi:hypothetical protein
MSAPSTNGVNGNGRGPDGRFAAGNNGGPGNPLASRVQAYRRAILQSVKPADVKRIVKKMVAQALAGDGAAQRELLDRLVGRPAATELLERVEALEKQFERKQP